MKITRTADGVWDVDGVGTLERNAQGAYFVSTITTDRLSTEQMEQIVKFVKDLEKQE
jgi:hypothetical protein